MGLDPRGLPDQYRGDHPATHWCYVLNGSVWWHYGGGREEVIEAGEASASRRDTRPVPRANSEFVIFSPADVMAVVEEGLKRTLVKGRAAAA